MHNHKLEPHIVDEKDGDKDGNKVDTSKSILHALLYKKTSARLKQHVTVKNQA